MKFQNKHNFGYTLYWNKIGEKNTSKKSNRIQKTLTASFDVKLSWSDATWQFYVIKSSSESLKSFLFLISATHSRLFSFQYKNLDQVNPESKQCAASDYLWCLSTAHHVSHRSVCLDFDQGNYFNSEKRIRFGWMPLLFPCRLLYVWTLFY